jgi:hypothetical protein
MSAEYVAADVAAGGGDLAQLVEEVNGGQVERAQLACGPDAAGPKCHGVGEQALDQVVGGVLEGGPVAVGEAAKASRRRPEYASIRSGVSAPVPQAVEVRLPGSWLRWVAPAAQ